MVNNLPSSPKSSQYGQKLVTKIKQLDFFIATVRKIVLTGTFDIPKSATDYTTSLRRQLRLVRFHEYLIVVEGFICHSKFLTKKYYLFRQSMHHKKKISHFFVDWYLLTSSLREIIAIISLNLISLWCFLPSHD